MSVRWAALWCALVVSTSICAAGIGWSVNAPRAAAVPGAGSAGACGRWAAKPGGTITRSVTVGGVVRTYRVHFPSTYTGLTRIPLVIAFHGHAEKGPVFERYTGLSGLPAVVVYPNALRGTDNTTAWQSAPYASRKADDVAFTRAILRSVWAGACVDATRTFAIGRSNGGGLVALLACRMPTRFAAFATISAAVYVGAVAGCRNGPPVSLVDFHGTSDRVIGYNGGRRFGTRYLSSSAWLQRWVQRAGCAPAPLVLPVNPVVERFSWSFCATGHSVIHYRINGGTHRWPGSSGNAVAGNISDTIDATRLIWLFFMTHPFRGSS
ncbi:PHB depolymerase family esterase [Gordonia sp. CPCC 206044]|uniref:alpha/beta hydrolase family esterase n=1 Tax=Gordonia sp. CPCC 206044 TaxID=3140793 RepID=UPI003AF3F258